jgi:hypothetical protein
MPMMHSRQSGPVQPPTSSTSVTIFQRSLSSAFLGCVPFTSSDGSWHTTMASFLAFATLAFVTLAFVTHSRGNDELANRLRAY